MPLQLIPPTLPGAMTDPSKLGGVNGPWLLYPAIRALDARLSAGVGPQASSTVNPCIPNGAGNTGKGWVGHASSPFTEEAGTGRSSIGKRDSPVTRLKTK